MSHYLHLTLLLAVSVALGQAPAPPQTPEIILPSQQKKLDDSRTLAGRPLPSTLNSLGGVTSELLAYFPMDDTAKGCLAWSRKPISVSATSQVAIRNENGRSYADFRQPGARLAFNPPLELGRRFTLAAWVEAPAPKNHGAIWHGGGALLMLLPASLDYWTAGKGGTYAKTASPITGWSHVSVVSDGNKTQAFLNGIPLDPVKAIVSGDLKSVGNHPDSKHHHWMMAAGIDEQYIFSRPLTPEDIKKLMAFSQPKK
ncbi:MAG TPA: LamG-like jellyroll fold domain-containing protein [Chthoniobacteraceae bacterium]|jgi:hypothetical protein